MRHSLRSLVAASAFFLGLVPTAEAKLAELLVTDSGVLKKVELDKASVEAEIDLAAAKITYDLTFVSSLGQAQEGTFYFALPRGSYIHEFGMWVDGQYQGSAIVEAQAGRGAYEATVRRGLDPALLEWSAGSTFKMRVFPVLPEKPTRVKLIVGMALDPVNGQLVGTIPLDLGKIGRFSLKVAGKAVTSDVPKFVGLKGLKLAEDDSSSGVMTFKGSFAAKNYLPPDDVRLSIDESSKAKVKIRREDGDKQRFFEAHLFPFLPEKKRPAAAKGVVYWDYSLSEVDHLDRRLEILKSYLAARKPPTVDVYGFSQNVTPVATNLKGSDWKGLEDAIRKRPYDGATRLDILADHVTSTLAKDQKLVTDLVLFTNGVDSFELFDFKRLSHLGNANLNAFIVAPSAGANDALLQKFASELSAVVLDQDQVLTATTFASMPWQVATVKGSSNLKELEPALNASLFAHDGIIIRGQVKKDGPSDLVVSFKQNGAKKSFKYRFDSDVDRGTSNTVARLWASRRIDRLMVEKRAHAAEIKSVALQHQLMSPYTVMVVLEHCEDYAEFKLEAPKGCSKRPEERFTDDEDAAEMDMAGDAAPGEGGSAGDAAPSDGGAPPPPSAFGGTPEEKVVFNSKDLGGERRGEASAKMAENSADEDNDLFVDREEFEESERFYEPEKDTSPQLFGFEKDMDAAAGKGVNPLYANYLKSRKLFSQVPYFYIHTAELFSKLKRLDLATLVLSNVVEIRPGDARWLRIYAYNLIAWGQAKDSVPIYRAIAELREEDPQSFRDYGLAMEAIGQPLAALKLFERVYIGKWDSRLAGMNKIIQHDLGRAAVQALKTPNLTPENRTRAEQFRKIDASLNDKVVITASWDTDGTDVDLHVVEPSGAHIYYADMTPKNAHGRLSFDTMQGFGPEQYRNPNPFKGNYRVFLHYYSTNPVAVRDGSLVRVDFKIIDQGIEKNFVKTVFLRDQDQTLTVLSFDYADPHAPSPPPNFNQGLSQVKKLLEGKQYQAALNAINALGKRDDSKEEALRYFHMARSQLGLKQYEQAEQSNQRALALNPELLSAHFNNACAGSLAKNQAKAILYLNMLADSLNSHPRQRKQFLNLMASDPDLTFVRGTKPFKAVVERLRVGH